MKRKQQYNFVDMAKMANWKCRSLQSSLLISLRDKTFSDNRKYAAMATAAVSPSALTATAAAMH